MSPATNGEGHKTNQFKHAEKACACTVCLCVCVKNLCVCVCAFVRVYVCIYFGGKDEKFAKCVCYKSE